MVGEPQETAISAQGRDEGWGERTRSLKRDGAKPRCPDYGDRDGPRGKRGGVSLGLTCSGTTPLSKIPLAPRPNTHLPSSGTNTHVPSPLFSSTGVPLNLMPVTGWGGWRGSRGHGSTHPRGPHLLMEIVVKQDQVEVALQAPQRPLPDTVLAATSLREEDGKGGR